MLAYLLANFSDEDPPEGAENDDLESGELVERAAPLERFLCWCRDHAREIEAEHWARAAQALDREIVRAQASLQSTLKNLSTQSTLFPEVRAALNLLTDLREDLHPPLSPLEFPLEHWFKQLEQLRLLQFSWSEFSGHRLCRHCGELSEGHLEHCGFCASRFPDAEGIATRTGTPGGLPSEYAQLHRLFRDVVARKAPWSQARDRLVALQARYRKALQGLQSLEDEEQNLDSLSTALQGAIEACDALLCFPETNDPSLLEDGWSMLMVALARALRAGGASVGVA